jgi:DHA1 family bicyclomycin/chloramphenicol resistance-like MFS transporter
LPNSAALVFAPFRRNAGTAAALFGAFEMIAGTLVSILITVFKTNSAITLSVIMAILALLVFTICRFGQQRIASSQATTPVLQKQKP